MNLSLDYSKFVQSLATIGRGAVGTSIQPTNQNVSSIVPTSSDVNNATKFSLGSSRGNAQNFTNPGDQAERRVTDNTRDWQLASKNLYNVGTADVAGNVKVASGTGFGDHLNINNGNYLQHNFNETGNYMGMAQSISGRINRYLDGKFGAIIHDKPANFEGNDKDWAMANIHIGRGFKDGASLAESLKAVDAMKIDSEFRTDIYNKSSIVAHGITEDQINTGKFDFLKEDSKFEKEMVAKYGGNYSLIGAGAEQARKQTVTNENNSQFEKISQSDSRIRNNSEGLKELQQWTNYNPSEFNGKADLGNCDQTHGVATLSARGRAANDISLQVLSALESKDMTKLQELGAVGSDGKLKNFELNMTLQSKDNVATQAELLLGQRDAQQTFLTANNEKSNNFVLNFNVLGDVGKFAALANRTTDAISNFEHANEKGETQHANLVTAEFDVNNHGMKQSALVNENSQEQLKLGDANLDKTLQGVGYGLQKAGVDVVMTNFHQCSSDLIADAWDASLGAGANHARQDGLGDATVIASTSSDKASLREADLTNRQDADSYIPIAAHDHRTGETDVVASHFSIASYNNKVKTENLEIYGAGENDKQVEALKQSDLYRSFHGDKSTSGGFETLSPETNDSASGETVKNNNTNVQDDLVQSTNDSSAANNEQQIAQAEKKKEPEKHDELV